MWSGRTYGHQCGIKPTDFSKLKSTKYVWRINPGANFETSMLGPMVILVASVKKQIGQGYYKSGRFFGRPFMSPFFAVICNLKMEIRLKSLWISR